MLLNSLHSNDFYVIFHTVDIPWFQRLGIINPHFHPPQGRLPWDESGLPPALRLKGYLGRGDPMIPAVMQQGILEPQKVRATQKAVSSSPSHKLAMVLALPLPLPLSPPHQATKSEVLWTGQAKGCSRWFLTAGEGSPDISGAKRHPEDPRTGIEGRPLQRSWVITWSPFP